MQRMRMEEREVAPVVDVIRVEHQFMKNNNYLAMDPLSRDAVLVDPAWQDEKIEAALAGRAARLRGILLTHAHFDHVHLAEQLSERHGCPVWMSEREIAASGYRAARLAAIDETPWQVGGLRIQPILTPGHTPGCACYLIGGHLFTGDVLFIEGCGICPDEAAAHQMFDSLERLKATLPRDTRIYPGHTYQLEPGQPLSKVLSCNIYLQFRDRESFAAYRLRSGQSMQKLLAFR